MEQVSCDDACGVTRPGVHAQVVGWDSKHLVCNMAKEGEDLASHDLAAAPGGSVKIYCSRVTGRCP